MAKCFNICINRYPHINSSNFALLDMTMQKRSYHVPSSAIMFNAPSPPLLVGGRWGEGWGGGLHVRSVSMPIRWLSAQMRWLSALHCVSPNQMDSTPSLTHVICILPRGQCVCKRTYVCVCVCICVCVCVCVHVCVRVTQTH